MPFLNPHPMPATPHAPEDAPPFGNLRSLADWVLRRRHRVQPDQPGTDGWSFPDGSEVRRPFELEADVGPQQPNQPDDVRKVQAILGRTGHYDAAQSGLDGQFTRPLREGIEAYQRLNGLEVDGWMAPGGETVRHAAAQFGHEIDGGADDPAASSVAAAAGAEAPAPGIHRDPEGRTLPPNLPKPSTIPPYRAAVPAVQKNHPLLREAIRHDDRISHEAGRIISDIAAAEGYGTDAKSGAKLGFLQPALTDVRKARPDLQGELPEKIAGLEVAHLGPAMQAYLNIGLGPYGGLDTVTKIGDAKSAAAMGDSVFSHGPAAGRGMIREAAVAAGRQLSAEQREKHGIGALDEKADAKATFDAIARLHQAGAGQEFRNQLARVRGRKEKWSERIDYYR